MYNILVSAIGGKRKATKRDNNFVLRTQYPQYVLYDVC